MIRMARYDDLAGKVVVLTGGANGIGAAAVRRFHQQNARVYFCDVDASAGNRLATELGDGVNFARVDLRRESQIKKWIAQTGRLEKRIDVLVNNAAADTRIALEKTSSKAWDDLFARNLRAYFLTARECVGWMKPGSSIINFASIVFHGGPANLCAYVATKGGVLGFTRSIARELGPRRIRVNTISPGWIMTARQLRDYVTPATKRLIKKSQCIPDLLQPEEIADVVLFLASDASRALTGQELLADRGWQYS